MRGRSIAADRCGDPLMPTEAQNRLQSSLAYVKFPFLRCPRVRLYRRDHRAKSLHDTMAYVAIVGVIRTEQGDVFALDEVPNLENRVSHEHPEIFYL